MKRISLLFLLAQGLSVSAMASPMDCSWNGGSADGGAKGDKITVAALTKDKIKITSISNEDHEEFKGAFKRARNAAGEEKVVHSKKENLDYLDYDAGMGDGALEVLVSESLVKEGKGILKLRRSGGDGGVTDIIFACPAKD